MHMMKKTMSKTRHAGHKKASRACSCMSCKKTVCKKPMHKKATKSRTASHQKAAKKTHR